MATKLDFAFRRLETLIEKYCIDGKEDIATEAIAWAWEYAHDYPQEADIQKAISLVKEAENYITEEGKSQYAKLRAEITTRLRHMLYDRKRKSNKKTKN